MSARNNTARSSGNYSRANVHLIGDMTSISRDIIISLCAAAVMVGVPFIMAYLKTLGVW